MTPPPSDPGPASERIAKRLARAGVASRRVSETMILAGRVRVNGRVIDSPALNVTEADRIEVDGQPLAAAEHIRLWRYYKPIGLVTSDRDEKGRDTVFQHLPEDLPRVMSIGRLDLNSEGLLLLTNDGDLKRRLELPSTGWVRKYRVRAKGIPTDAMLDPLRKGVTVDGERFQPMSVAIDRQQGANAWLTMGIREGKNREIRRALESVGLSVNRLIRVSYGPFQLGDLVPGGVEEVRSKVMREQLGVKRPVEGGARRIAPTVPTGRNPARCRENRASDLEVARALAPVAPVDQLVFYRLIVLQALQARLLDGGDMDEDVLAAVFRLDESVALFGIEPLYRAFSHSGMPFGRAVRTRRPDVESAARRVGTRNLSVAGFRTPTTRSRLPRITRQTKRDVRGSRFPARPSPETGAENQGVRAASRRRTGHRVW